MVKTRSQTAKADKTAKADMEKTKRTKGGNGGGKDGGDNMDEVKFREFLAHIFPSKFAEQQLAAAKKRKAARGTGDGKRSKVAKYEDDSDASSTSACDDTNDDGNGNGSGSSGWKVFTVVNGIAKPVRGGVNPHRAMSKHIRESRRKAKQRFPKRSRRFADESEFEDEGEGESEEDNESDDVASTGEDYDENGSECDSSSDYVPDEDEDGWNTVSEEEDEDEDELECEDDTLEELLDRDSCDDVVDRRCDTTSSQAAEVPRIELEVAEKEFNGMVEGAPKVFQKRCHNIWREFKTKLEKERAQFIAKGKKMEKKTKRENLTSFRRLLREGEVMNDLRYFNRFMTVAEQQQVITEMERVKAYSRIDKPYRLRLLDAPIPPQTKAVALKKIDALRYTSPGDGEYNKLKKWVDAFLHIPFGKHSKLELSLTDGQDKCHAFMEDARKTLDDAVYGLDDVKLQVMQMLGQWLSNPNAVGNAMAIHGPMGTGKTTLVKDGISKILGREFIFIALGGATDSSFLEGHSYTYEGSTWGKIVDLLMQCQTMNPIIYFDELDKVSDSPRGEEIIGILTHLTDTSQNDKFHDKYFSEVEFDLSKCMFFFSYNDPERVNPILRDRMYTIKTNGYSAAEKVTIAEKHLIPKLLPQVGFNSGEVTIPIETLDYIAKEYTSDDEKGVRSLKRRLEIILTKLNLYRLLKPGTTMFGQKIPETVTFPMSVSEELVRELLKKDKTQNDNHWVMYT